MKIMITGGAGYIGSHACKILHDVGHKIMMVDNRSMGAFMTSKALNFIQLDLRECDRLTQILKEYSPDIVMHFASLIDVKQSLFDPASYYENNIMATLSLLNAMRDAKIENIIFSSSAAVYGNPINFNSPIDENHPCAPINVYGRTKVMIEQILQDYDVAYGIKSICLRYFNASGGLPHDGLGENHPIETHLIPLLLQTALGKNDFFSLYGQDFPTEDGTAIRDFIHVKDLIEAHIIASKYLIKQQKSDIFNLGAGRGYSILQMIKKAKTICQKEIPITNFERREGDPAYLVANIEKAQKILDWSPVYSDIDKILMDAWEWEKSRYKAK